MPQILKSHRLEHRISNTDAKINVARSIQHFQHIRDLTMLAKLQSNGYEILMNAEFIYSEVYHFQDFLFPKNFTPYDIGVSTIEETKYKGKTKFLKSFYKIDNPIY